jgi:hypothetical protein
MASRKTFESNTQTFREPRRAKPTSSRAAGQWLEDEADFRSIAAQAERLIEITRALHEIHPAQPMMVLGLDQGTMKIASRNAAEAARLRQIEPRLVAQLRNRGIAVERLRIQTRRHAFAAQGGSAVRLSSGRGPIPDQALGALHAIREGLSPGRLSRALDTLNARQRRQRKT